MIAGGSVHLGAAIRRGDPAEPRRADPCRLSDLAILPHRRPRASHAAGKEHAEFIEWSAGAPAAGAASVELVMNAIAEPAATLCQISMSA